MWNQRAQIVSREELIHVEEQLGQTKQFCVPHVPIQTNGSAMSTYCHRFTPLSRPKVAAESSAESHKENEHGQGVRHEGTLVLADQQGSQFWGRTNAKGTGALHQT